jgi:hypothetical protein
MAREHALYAETAETAKHAGENFLCEFRELRAFCVPTL